MDDLDDDFGADFEDECDEALEAAAEALSVRDHVAAEAHLRTALDHDDALARSLAGEALSLIEVGLPADAARRIECWCRPKFASLSLCRKAYRAAMGARS